MGMANCNKMRTVSFKTLGCKVNQYETQAIREQFLEAGYTETLNGPADFYVINTCTVTANSDSKSRQLIRASHRLNPKATIIVTGCYVERNRADIERTKGVNFIVGNSQKNEIVKIIQSGSCASHLSPHTSRSYQPLRISNFEGHSRAFLKIQDGCNQRCSYCKVRIVRGRSRSRDLDDIVDEAKRLTEAGFKEIVLSGIQIGSYGKDLWGKVGLCEVIERLEVADGIRRIRISSIEPMDIANGLIRKIATSSRLCRHLHIPLQSGDDMVLARMNRGYRARDFKKLIRRIRRTVKDVSITTDIMVGFPGEGEANFARTLKMVREIMPSRVHIFPYSRREGTKAADFWETVPTKEIKNRITRLREIALTPSFTYRKQFRGRKVNILVETKRDPRTGLLCGYTDTYIKVLIEGPDSLMNEIVPVEVTDVGRDYTMGTL